MTTPTDRPNTDLAATVNRAMAMADRQAAARYLEQRGAGMAIICRVLDPAAQRRARQAPAER